MMSLKSSHIIGNVLLLVTNYLEHSYFHKYLIIENSGGRHSSFYCLMLFLMKEIVAAPIIIV